MKFYLKKIGVLYVLFLCNTVFCQNDSIVKNEPKICKPHNNIENQQLQKQQLVVVLNYLCNDFYNSNLNNPFKTATNNAFGITNPSDIRLYLNYGLTENITIGIGASKYRELIDGNVKWRFLKQGLKIPVSLSFFGRAGYVALNTTKLYEGTLRTKTNELDRLQYTSQLQISKQFTDKLFLQLMPTYTHRNYIKELINTKNDITDANGLFSLGFAAKIKVTNRCNFIMDYFYSFSKFQKNNPLGYFNTLCFGFEFHAKGYQLQLTISNRASLIESNFLTQTNTSFKTGQIKLGCNLSKIFNL